MHHVRVVASAAAVLAASAVVGVGKGSCRGVALAFAAFPSVCDPSRRQSAAGGGKRTMMMMAAPRKKLPDRSVEVFCSACKTKLYKYKKGGKGSLVKCYVERIVEDYTGGKLTCPGCQQEFARAQMIHGRPAFKMIGGKVYQKK